MYVHVRIHICFDKPELFVVDVGVVTYVKHKTLSERHATLGIYTYTSSHRMPTHPLEASPPSAGPGRYIWL